MSPFIRNPAAARGLRLGRRFVGLARDRRRSDRATPGPVTTSRDFPAHAGREAGSRPIEADRAAHRRSPRRNTLDGHGNPSSQVRRISHGLKPHRVRYFKLVPASSTSSATWWGSTAAGILLLRRSRRCRTQRDAQKGRVRTKQGPRRCSPHHVATGECDPSVSAPPPAPGVPPFLRIVEKRDELDLHFILDNYATHKHAKVSRQAPQGALPLPHLDFVVNLERTHATRQAPSCRPAGARDHGLKDRNRAPKPFVRHCQGHPGKGRRANFSGSTLGRLPRTSTA